MSNGALFFWIIVVPIVAFSIYVYRENKIVKQAEAAKSAEVAKADEPSHPVATIEPQEEQTAETVPEVKADPKPAPIVRPVLDVELKQEKKGHVLGFVGFIITLVVWFLWTISQQESTTIVAALQLVSIRNPYNIMTIATVLSFFGWAFRDASVTLLSAIALVLVFLFDYTAFFVIIPAIIAMVASVQMRPHYEIKVKK
jgi:hypothetical protein